MDASISKGVLVNWSFSWFPIEERPSAKWWQLYLQAWEHGRGKKSPEGFVRTLSYLLSTSVQIFISHSLNTETSTYAACMVSKPCNIPSSLCSFSWGLLRAGIYEVWHQCDGFICHCLGWREDVSDKHYGQWKEQRNGFRLNWKECV